MAYRKHIYKLKPMENYQVMRISANRETTLFKEGYIICDELENHDLNIEDFEMELF